MKTVASRRKLVIILEATHTVIASPGGKGVLPGVYLHGMAGDLLKKEWVKCY